MSKYLSCAETAKLIRKAFAEAFPGIKFGVRSQTYSGGASIHVSWTDGPNRDQVEAVAGRFEGSYFDGMQDYKGSLHHVLDGEVVSFGADFIFYNRNFSDAAVQRAIDGVYAHLFGNFKRDGIAKPELADYRAGRLWNTQLSGLHIYGDQNVQAEVNKRLHKSSDRLAVRMSNLAARVIALGNDGYSDVGALKDVA